MNFNATFLGQVLFFGILIWFSWKFIWPPLMKAIEDRQARIAEGLVAADRSQKDLAQAEEQVSQLMREARSKANEIIEQAHSRGSQIIDKAREDALAEASRQKGLALSEIESAANRAREDLRRQLSVLAVAGAEKLIRREIDASTHKDLLDELAAQL
jgi:F-type H+-transporting ATPase subunit b